MTVVVEQSKATSNPRTAQQVLASLAGQVITVVSTDSYIPTLTGYKIAEEAFKAKIVSCEQGTLKLVVEFLANPQKNIREKAFQFIPMSQVKRITISKTDRFLTI